VNGLGGALACRRFSFSFFFFFWLSFLDIVLLHAPNSNVFFFFFILSAGERLEDELRRRGIRRPDSVRYFIRFLIIISDNLLYVYSICFTFSVRTKKNELPVFRGKAILLVFSSSRSRPATIEHFSGERGALSYDATDGDDRHFFFFLFICFSLSFSSCCCCCMP
jgi:hypothetical protein